MKSVFLFSWAVLIGFGAASRAYTQAEKKPISLMALEAAAMHTYPSLAALNHAIQIAEARLTEARFSPFSQFTLTGGITFAPELRGNPVYSSDSQILTDNLNNPFKPVYRVGVEGVIPVYTFGKLSGVRAAAKAGVDAANWDKTRGTRQLQYDVRRGYFGLRVALDLKDMLSEGKEKLDVALANMEEKMHQKKPDAETGDETLEMGRWRLASAVAEVAARVSEVQKGESSATSALNVLTGISDIEVQQCPIEPVVYKLQSLRKYIDIASKRRPELQMLEAALAARRADADIKQANLFPDVGVGLSYTYSRAPGITDQTNPFISDPNFYGPGYGLGARWSLDFPGNLARKKQADEAFKQTQAQAEEARRGVSLEISTVYYQIEDALRRIDAWAKGRKEGRAWFIASAQGYQLGTVEARILIDSVRAYFTAKANHLSAIQDYNTGLANLERAVGAPLMDKLQWDPPCEE